MIIFGSGAASVELGGSGGSGSTVELDGSPELAGESSGEEDGFAPSKHNQRHAKANTEQNGCNGETLSELRRRENKLASKVVLGERVVNGKWTAARRPAVTLAQSERGE